MMKFLAVLLFTLSTFLCQAQNVRFQIGLGASLDYFRTDYLREIEGKQVSPILRGGISWEKSERLSFQVQGTLTMRKYNLNAGEESFRYSFFTAEVPLSIKYRFYQKWYGELGIIGSVYQPTLRSDNPEIELGGDFAYVDLALLGGLGFELSEKFSVGFRSRISFIPMLEYTPISNYGEFMPSKRDIYHRNAEIYLQYAFVL